MDRSLQFRVYAIELYAHFRLAFATAAEPVFLNLALQRNSPVHYAKGMRSGVGFRIIRTSLSTACKRTVSGYYFTALLGVLFTFPSRYWFTIGHRRVFSLGKWTSQIPTRFPRVWRYLGTSTEVRLVFEYRTITFYGRTFQNDFSNHRLGNFLDGSQPVLSRPATPTLQRLTAYIGLVWAVPFSLTATGGMRFLFFSSGYLDVSVPRVSLPVPMYSVQDTET